MSTELCHGPFIFLKTRHLPWVVLAENQQWKWVFSLAVQMLASTIPFLSHVYKLHVLLLSVDCLAVSFDRFSVISYSICKCLVHFIYVVKFMCTQLAVAFSYYSPGVCMSLCLLYFFQGSVLLEREICQFYWVFQRTGSLFCCFSVFKSLIYVLMWGYFKKKFLAKGIKGKFILWQSNCGINAYEGSLKLHGNVYLWKSYADLLFSVCLTWRFVFLASIFIDSWSRNIVYWSEIFPIFNVCIWWHKFLKSSSHNLICCVSVFV